MPNRIFPMDCLGAMMDILNGTNHVYRIRYRGPRTIGEHVHPKTGRTYYRDRTMTKQDCLKLEATGFVVYVKDESGSMQPIQV